jgi:hypothetical protein
LPVGVASAGLGHAVSRERDTGNAIKDVQCRVKHPVIRFMAATLDGVVAGTGAVYEAKFMLPWSFSEEFAAETPGSPTPSVGCGTRPCSRSAGPICRYHCGPRGINC